MRTRTSVGAVKTRSEAAFIATEAERRRAERIRVEGSVWLADKSGSVLTRGEIQNASHEGVQIRVPVGFGMNVGQSYELRSYAPGTSPAAFDLHPSRWAKIVRTKLVVRDKDAALEMALRYLS